MDDEETEENVNEEESNEDNSLPGTSHSQALPEPSIQDKEVLIVFDRDDIKKLNEDRELYWLKNLFSGLSRINDFNGSERINTYSAIPVNKEIFALSWTKKIYSINPLDEDSSWVEKKESRKDHGKEPAAAFLESQVQTSNGTTSTQVRQEIYLCGGGWAKSLKKRGLPKLTNNCEKYNLDSDNWEDIASMRKKKRSHSVIEMEGNIYSIGGVGEKQVSDGKLKPEVEKCENDQEDGEEDTEEPLSLVEKYDPKIDTWSDVASMNEPRVAPAVTQYKGNIYVLGGGVDYIYLSSVERYDPKYNTWTYLSSMNTGRILFRAFVFDEKMFAVGSNGDRRNGPSKDKSIESVKLDDLINKPNEANWETEEDWLANTDCNFMATVKMALPRSIQTE